VSGDPTTITPGAFDWDAASVVCTSPGVAYLAGRYHSSWGLYEPPPTIVTMAAGDRFTLPGGRIIRRVLIGTTAGLRYGP
jgi:hypothetical protein